MAAAALTLTHLLTLNTQKVDSDLKTYTFSLIGRNWAPQAVLEMTNKMSQRITWFPDETWVLVCESLDKGVTERAYADVTPHVSKKL